MGSIHELRRRVSVLTGGLLREQFCPFGFIELPDYTNNARSKQLQTKRKIITGGYHTSLDRTRDRLNLFKPSNSICPPNAKSGQFISPFRALALQATIPIPMIFGIVATDGYLPFLDFAVLEPDFVRHKHARIFKAALG